MNAVQNMGVVGPYGDAVKALGYALEDLAVEEPDAGLGNGGLGRLASCFLDSVATLNYPAWGYGLRYKYGLFRQEIDLQSGQQTEFAERWLAAPNPWEASARYTLHHALSIYLYSVCTGPCLP